MSRAKAEFMHLALEQANRAARQGEVPVGAVIVSDAGETLSRARNQVIGRCDPTAHAEMLAMREAASILGNYRLLNTTLYVTVEPCVMCMGAVIHARIATVVFGAGDPKWGAAGSLYHFADDNRFNHQPQVIGGLCAPECRRLMQDFFRIKRNSTQPTRRS